MTRINKRTLTPPPPRRSPPRDSCLPPHPKITLVGCTYTRARARAQPNPTRRPTSFYTVCSPTHTRTHTCVNIYEPFVFLSYTLRRPLGRFFSPLSSLHPPARAPIANLSPATISYPSGRRRGAIYHRRRAKTLRGRRGGGSYTPPNGRPAYNNIISLSREQIYRTKTKYRIVHHYIII